MNFKQILLGVIIVIILYLIYTYVFNDSTSNTLYSGGNAKTPVKIKASALPGNKASVNFSYSIWIYVDNWQYRYGTNKVIYSRKAGNVVSPEVALGAATNDLIINMSLMDSGGSGVTSTPWTVSNIPIQKWCNIIISTNNRAIDTYIDGKLVNTHVLAGVLSTIGAAPIMVSPLQASGELGGFSGQTSKFRYIARTISPREAYDIYREGPGGNWLSDLLNQYKMKLSFLKGNEEINSFEI
jgi:hypothetical protein